MPRVADHHSTVCLLILGVSVCLCLFVYLLVLLPAVYVCMSVCLCVCVSVSACRYLCPLRGLAWPTSLPTTCQCICLGLTPSIVVFYPLRFGNFGSVWQCNALFFAYLPILLIFKEEGFILNPFYYQLQAERWEKTKKVTKRQKHENKSKANTTYPHSHARLPILLFGLFISQM